MSTTNVPVRCGIKKCKGTVFGVFLIADDTKAGFCYRHFKARIKTIKRNGAVCTVRLWKAPPKVISMSAASADGGD
jgi:hypothetical protein